MIGSGNGVLSVQGTTDYEQHVLDYGDPLLPALNDDYIPNRRNPYDTDDEDEYDGDIPDIDDTPPRIPPPA